MNVELENFIAQLPHQIDLTRIDHADILEKSLDFFNHRMGSVQEVISFEEELKSSTPKANIFALSALKILRSKLLIQEIDQEIEVSVVLAMYKEHHRIQKAEVHPHGEDFLRRKIHQMELLFGDKPNINFNLILVDDGCPEHSGQIAQKIIQEEQLEEHAHVLFLQDAIDKGLPIAKNIKSTSESQKGGSVEYGMWWAAQNNPNPNHIVVFTDADLSTHLGQLGLLIYPILTKGKKLSIASRREQDSVVIKQAGRNDRGKLFIYLWKRLLNPLHGIIDTQCGFKAFRADILEEVLQDLIESKFAFDIELILKSLQLDPNGIEKVGIAWIDSEAASTTTDLQPYLPMLKSIAEMYRKYLGREESADQMADFIDHLNEESFQTLLENIPIEISSREPISFDGYKGVDIGSLQKSAHIPN